MLELHDVSKSYVSGAGLRRVFSGVQLCLQTGETVAIMGESGVGKSTLLNVIAGIDVADGGRVVLDGVDLAGLDETARTLLRRRRLGFVFQAFHLLPYLSVADNVALPVALNGRVDAAARQRVAHLLAAVGLGGRGADLPTRLSGGEMQRVAIARALAHRPALVLADEPTGNLDPATAHEVMALLRGQLADCGASALIVTHSSAVAASAHRVLRLGADGLVPMQRPQG